MTLKGLSKRGSEFFIFTGAQNFHETIYRFPLSKYEISPLKKMSLLEAEANIAVDTDKEQVEKVEGEQQQVDKIEEKCFFGGTCWLKMRNVITYLQISVQ